MRRGGRGADGRAEAWAQRIRGTEPRHVEAGRPRSPPRLSGRDIAEASIEFLEHSAREFTNTASRGHSLGSVSKIRRRSAQSGLTTYKQRCATVGLTFYWRPLVTAVLAFSLARAPLSMPTMAKFPS